MQKRNKTITFYSLAILPTLLFGLSAIAEQARAFDEVWGGSYYSNPSEYYESNNNSEDIWGGSWYGKNGGSDKDNSGNNNTEDAWGGWGSSSYGNSSGNENNFDNTDTNVWGDTDDSFPGSDGSYWGTYTSPNVYGYDEVPAYVEENPIGIEENHNTGEHQESDAFSSPEWAGNEISMSASALSAPDGRLRILILANRFSESQMGQAHTRAADFRNQLVALAPFNNYANKIDVEVRRATQDLGCAILLDAEQLPTRIMTCNSTTVLPQSATGSYDEVIVLHNDSENWAGGGHMDESSENYKTDSLSSFAMATLKLSVGGMVHEFGHSFGSLDDEYFYDDDATIAIPRRSVNCVATPSQLTGNYRQGCGQVPVRFTPAEESIMLRTDILSFNRVSIESDQLTHGLRKRLDYFTTSSQTSTPPDLLPPANLRTNIVGTTLTLSWDPRADASSYQVEVGSRPGASDLFVATINSTQASQAIPPGTYYLRVRAIYPNGPSAPSDEVVAVVNGGGGCSRPSTPNNLGHGVIGNLVKLYWNPSPGATEYNVSAWMNGVEVINQSVGQATSLESQAPSGIYNVFVRALNACGVSDPASITVVVP